MSSGNGSAEGAKTVVQDSIVARLRAVEVQVQRTLPDYLVGFPSLHAEAANEIERLMAELSMAVKWRDNYKLAFEHADQNAKYWHQKAATSHESTENSTDLTNIITLLRDISVMTDDRKHETLAWRAADEIERLWLACHYLAGWISYHDKDIDPKEVVKTAYEKAVK